MKCQKHGCRGTAHFFVRRLQLCSILRSFLFTGVTVGLLASSVSARADYTAVVNPGSVLVTNFQGWGTSLAWWANVIGSYPNRTNYVDLAFNQLKLNIVRYNIGGGQNPTITVPGQGYRTMMPGFEPTSGSWNWNADTNQRWVLQQALARGANIVEAFANSPPWWMCVNKNVDGNVEGTNNLAVNYEVTFADYLATVVSNLTVLDGVHFDYVIPMNEPSQATTNALQEFCHVSRDQQARLIGDLRAALNTSLPAAGVDAPGDIDEVQSYSDLTDANYTATIFGDLGLISTHNYGGTSQANMKNKAASEGKRLWMAEYGDSDATGMKMAHHIHDDITGMGVCAWINWQVVDPSWGLLANSLLATTNSSYNPNYTINEKFYVMGQFSEFIRPGYKIISVNDTNTLAAYNPTNSTLVLVMVNTSAGLNVTYNLSSFGSLPWQVSAMQTASGENMITLPSPVVANGQFTAAVPTNSVTTFVLTTNLTAPAIVEQVPSTYTNPTSVFAGQVPTFSVSASGSVPLYYQWWSNGVVVAGATNSSYAPPGLSPNGPASFACIVSNMVGAATSQWSVATEPAPTASYPTAVLALHPIGYWRLNEAEQGGGDNGMIAFDRVGGNNGIYTNVLLGQASYSALTDPADTSARFGLVSSKNSCVYGIVGPDFALANGANAEFTVQSWVKSTGANGLNTPTVAAKGYYYGEEYALDAGAAGGCYRFSVRNAAGTAWNANSTVSLTNSGQWYHLVGVCDEANGAVLLYINGIVTASSPISSASGIINSSQTPMTIGSRSSSPANGFDQQFPGYISDVAIYNYALSSSQVQTLYQAGVSFPPVGLSLTNVGTNVQLNWIYGVLQSATNIAGPFIDMSNVVPPYQVPPTNDQEFFRVREN